MTKVKSNRVFRMEILLNSEEKVLIMELAKKEKMSVPDYIRLCSIKEPKNDPKLKKYYSEIIRVAKLNIIQLQSKINSFHLFLDKNGMRRLFESAKFSMFQLGKINMSEIHLIIRDYKKIYDNLPDEIKALKKDSMKEMENCANQNYLMDKLKIHQNQVSGAETAYLKTIKKNSTRNILEHKRNKK